MRVRSLAAVLAVAATVLVTPLQATAKGSLAGFDRRFYVPGDVASARMEPGPWRDLRDLPPAPRSLYLVPWRRWHGTRSGLLPTIPVDAETVRVFERTIRVRFTVPAVPAGDYKVAICSTRGPCDARTIVDLVGDRLTIVDTREELPLWRQLDRVAALASSAQRQVASLEHVLYRQHWRQVFQARLAEIQVQLDSVTDRVERLEALRPAPTVAGSTTPAVVAASAASVVLGALLVGRGRRVMPRRRRGAGSPHR